MNAYIGPRPMSSVEAVGPRPIRAIIIIRNLTDNTIPMMFSIISMQYYTLFINDVAMSMSLYLIPDNLLESPLQGGTMVAAGLVGTPFLEIVFEDVMLHSFVMSNESETTSRLCDVATCLQCLRNHRKNCDFAQFFAVSRECTKNK